MVNTFIQLSNPQLFKTNPDYISPIAKVFTNSSLVQLIASHLKNTGKKEDVENFSRVHHIIHRFLLPSAKAAPLDQASSLFTCYKVLLEMLKFQSRLRMTNPLYTEEVNEQNEKPITYCISFRKSYSWDSILEQFNTIVQTTPKEKALEIQWARKWLQTIHEIYQLNLTRIFIFTEKNKAPFINSTLFGNVIDIFGLREFSEFLDSTSLDKLTNLFNFYRNSYSLEEIEKRLDEMTSQLEGKKIQGPEENLNLSLDDIHKLRHMLKLEKAIHQFKLKVEEEAKREDFVKNYRSLFLELIKNWEDLTLFLYWPEVLLKKEAFYFNIKKVQNAYLDNFQPPSDFKNWYMIQEDPLIIKTLSADKKLIHPKSLTILKSSTEKREEDIERVMQNVLKDLNEDLILASKEDEKTLPPNRVVEALKMIFPPLGILVVRFFNNNQ